MEIPSWILHQKQIELKTLTQQNCDVQQMFISINKFWKDKTILLIFIGPCVLSTCRYISNKMQIYTVYLSLETTLHVSGGTSTHHQERTQLYLQHLVLVKPLLLPAAVVEEMELHYTSAYKNFPLLLIFMSPCNVSIFRYISNKMQIYTKARLKTLPVT